MFPLLRPQEALKQCQLLVRALSNYIPEEWRRQRMSLDYQEQHSGGNSDVCKNGIILWGMASLAQTLTFACNRSPTRGRFCEGRIP